MTKYDKSICCTVILLAVATNGYFVLVAGLQKYQAITAFMLFGSAFLICGALKTGRIQYNGNGPTIFRADQPADFHRSIVFVLFIFAIIWGMCLLLHLQEQGNKRMLNDKMIIASGTGDVAEIRRLLKNGASPNNQGIDGWTPLTAAAKGGQLDAVKALVDNNADIEGTDIGGGTALFWASAYGKTDIIAFLLAKGASLNHSSDTGNTPLMEARSRGQQSAVRLLIERGANLETK